MSGERSGERSARGVAAAGVYLPRYRLTAEELREAWGMANTGGIERKAVAAADEDALTMAAVAVEEALDRYDGDSDDISFLGIATTTPPVAEEEFTSRVVRMLDLPRDLETLTATQSTAAGADVIAAAADADGPALAVAADFPEGAPEDADHRFGAGAVAFLFDEGGDAVLTGRGTHADEYPGIRFRERGERDVESLDITTYERGATRECVTRAVEALDADPASIAGMAIHQPNAKLPYRIAPSVVDAGVVARGTVVDRVGDLGAATVPLGLLAALDSAAETEAEEEGEASTEKPLTVAAFFGSGARGVALAFEGSYALDVDSRLEGGVEVSYPEYLRERGYVVEEGVAGGGAHVSLPSWRRTLDQRYRLLAGRCPECGELSFPPEGACESCGARVEFEPVELPRTGTVAAATVIGHGGAPPEFTVQQQRAGPFGVVIVEFEVDDSSTRMPAQLADCDPESVEVGDEVRAVVRRIYEQEGVTRYGTKFTPAE